VNDLSFFDYGMVCFSAMEPSRYPRVDLGDFVGTTIGLLLDQSPWGRAALAERAIAKPRVSTN
jgi:hypothetical protein